MNYKTVFHVFSYKFLIYSVLVHRGYWLVSLDSTQVLVIQLLQLQGFLTIFQDFMNPQA